MLNNINISRYYETNSIVHKLHPLSKLIMIIFFLISILISDKINLIIFVITIFLIMESNIPIINYLKLIKSLRAIIICLIIVNLLAHFTLIKTFNTVINLILILLLSSILNFTTKPMDITYGLQFLLTPFKIIGVSTNELSIQLTLAFRFIPSIIDEANKILKSQSTRGVDYNEAKINKKMEIIKSMIMPLLNNCFRKADNLSDVMELRVYPLNGKRTHFKMKKWSKFDSYIVIMSVLIFLLSMLGVL